MQVDVIASVNEARAIELANRTVIVIDVLRATSTIITALAHGASGILPVETVQQAKQAARDGDITGGERNCKKIPGFDAGNSPFEYMGESVYGKRVVLTTSNGTRAIHKASKADVILAGAFLNASECARTAYQLRKDIAVLCAGTQDEFAFEDALCAGLIVAELFRLGRQEQEMRTNDLGSILVSAYRHHEGAIPEALLACSGGMRLAKLGYAKDVEYCAGIDTVSVVPVWVQQMMLPFAT
ncbi:2-phosphosulfolactate phosphatase [Paenibacillus dendritiformis]|uniref:2-phosphosulfolactate phosphatase n=1 Tax=Paenibacillus dendritiformis TaxID=130049 RepID=UPI000DAAA0A0|nr:2-phosphosulfolactate phosphatase [Paenibacillus dendritiformis]PZM64365.1 2-phosphosulfolactate phosphatase [Paenibacillus dendritiformis]